MTVYVVERVAWTVDGWTPPVQLRECDGEDGASRVPVEAFARESDAIEAAVKRTMAEWEWLSPAWLDYDTDDDEIAAVRAIIRRHGFTPPQQADGFTRWWRNNAPLPFELTLQLWLAVGEKRPLYRIERRALED